MNKTNILKLADHIERLEPEEYDQRVFEHDCGTPACIAGHAALCSMRGWGTLFKYHPTPILSARKWLGLDSTQTSLLFAAFPLNVNANPTQQDAAATLRHLAETGEVVWRHRSLPGSNEAGT